MKKNIKKFKVDKMICTGCENKIEKALKKLKGIDKVEARFSNSTVEVTYDEELIEEKQIIQKIESLDYKVVLGKKYIKAIDEKSNDNLNKNNENNKFNILKFIGVMLLLILAYLIIQNTIGFNFIPEVNNTMGYGMLFVIGLLTSLHCVAMCGGINISQCASYKDKDYKNKFIPSLLYNLGRVISYTLIGGIFGAFGSLISISNYSKAIIAIIVGILMLIMGLNMLNIFPWLRKINPRMPKFILNKINKKTKGNEKRGTLYVGLLNGLIPCGPLQAMQIYALGTGSFLLGSLSMFVFSLGTIPLMFGLGALSSLLTSKFNKKMLKVSAILVMFLGVVMFVRGTNLAGISLIPKTTSNVTENKSLSNNIAFIDGDFQTVTITLENGKYSPIVVQKGIPVKWTINVKSGQLTGCNNKIIIPEYNISKKLVIGDNLIEFTPTETKDIVYTCWMGMISSNINVIDDLSKVKNSDIIKENKSSPNSSSSGSSCCSVNSTSAINNP